METKTLIAFGLCLEFGNLIFFYFTDGKAMMWDTTYFKKWELQ